VHAKTLTAELLCAHHSLEGFESGHSESDQLAAALLERVRDRDMDGFVAVVAANETTHRIFGIIAATDVFLVGVPVRIVSPAAISPFAASCGVATCRDPGQRSMMRRG